MPFSFTAPKITPDEELLERESLTMEELESVDHDVFGTFDEVDDIVETAEVIEEGLQKIKAALEDFHEDDKSACLEAQYENPDIFARESNPLMFLRSEKFDAWAAADRLVNYWELRRWLFGERYLLPMILTGDGALDENDIRLLEEAPVMLLKQDYNGRAIIFLDETRIDPMLYDRLALVRVIFYFLSVAIESKDAQLRGIVILSNTKEYTTNRFDRKYYKYLKYLFAGYHPVNIRCFHICAPPGKSSFLLVLPFIKYFMSKYLRLRMRVHTGTNREIQHDLAVYGIDQHSLPESLGGVYEPGMFQSWVEERKELEISRILELPSSQGNMILI